MKRFVAVPIALAAATLGGVGIWYWARTSGIESALKQFEDEAKSRQIVKAEVVVTVPPETPADQRLYLAGSAPALGNWDAAGVPMERGDDGKHRATVEVMSGINYGFKVTRGTWSTVERGPGGADMPDRPLNVTSPGAAIEASVATWVDGGKSIPNRITTTGDVRLHKKFASKILGNERTIVVHVPPGYNDNPEQRYPVAYFQDGQNLFDEATSFAGVEWKLDEAAERLARSGGMEPAILVGIYNSEQRTPEFTPPALGTGGSARGDDYARFVVEEVKPFVDKTYRTRLAPEDTCIAGSAMGGLIALHIANTKPDVFGRVATLTPWLRVNANKSLLDAWSGDVAWLKDKRFWLDMGDQTVKNYPSDTPIADAQAFVKALDAAGIKPGETFSYTEILGEGGEHNEAGWSNRVDQVLAFVFPPKAGGATSAPATASRQE